MCVSPLAGFYLLIYKSKSDDSWSKKFKKCSARKKHELRRPFNGNNLYGDVVVIIINSIIVLIIGERTSHAEHSNLQNTQKKRQPQQQTRDTRKSFTSTSTAQHKKTVAEQRNFIDHRKIRYETVTHTHTHPSCAI